MITTSKPTLLIQKLTYFSIAFLFLTACSGNGQKVNSKGGEVEYEVYFNDRYHYSVEYPDFLIPQGEADSEDGQKFISEDEKIQMMVFYQFKNDAEADGENLPIEKAFEEELSWKEGVISKKLEKDYYLIESVTGNVMFTEYVFFRDNYFDIYFEYPENEKNRMKSIINHVVKSFYVENGNTSAGEYEDNFPSFLEGFLNDCYWGKNFNNLLRNNDKAVAKYLDKKMDIRRYYAPGTIAKLGTRADDFGFAPEDDFMFKPKPTGDLIFEYINDESNPCELIYSNINVIYYENIDNVPDIIVNNETFDTRPVKMAYHDARIVAVYLADKYDNPRGFYFIYTPEGWKLAFVDDSFCSA